MRFGLGLALLVFFTQVWAVVPVPKLASRITDLTQTLSIEQISALETKLAEFERNKGSQIAVLIITSTQPESIEEYSIKVADLWQVGRKSSDDGVILIIAKEDRRLRLEVGYGLEGAIPDAIAKRIISETIAPYFQKDDYAGGIDAGISQIMRLIDGEALPAPKHNPGQRQDQNPSVFIFILMGGLLIGSLLSAIFGRVLGGAVAGVGSAAAATLLFGFSLAVIIIGLIVFSIIGIRQSYGGWHNGGGFGGGMGGGSWSGGGGRFGGGGASGSW
jgi:uncharacterized protein